MKTQSADGMALIITLAFIVIITILAVGLSDTARLARPAAHSHLERVKAIQFAQAGVEQVIGTLQQQTNDLQRSWVSQPGRIVAGLATDDTATAVDERKKLSVETELSSGFVDSNTVSSFSSTFRPPNLNVATFRDPGKSVISERRDAAGNVLPMFVQWIYVRENGNWDRNPVPAILSDNKIVGRFAYWADDESSKINYNTAWGRSSNNTDAPGHPSKIELTVLTNVTQSLADAVRAFIVPGPSIRNHFNSPLDARRLEFEPNGAGAAAALEQNKFDVTHYNSDPNTTFFNEPRIVLTTRPDRAGWRYDSGLGKWVGVNGRPWPDGRPMYIGLLTDAKEGTVSKPNQISGGSNDPANLANVDGTKLTKTVNALVEYLQRSDWPFVEGAGSFQSKYYGEYPASMQTSRLVQMAVDIVDYVRAVESPQALVCPIRGRYDAAAKAFTLVDASANSYMGISRTPYITEIGAWFGIADQAIEPENPSFTRPIAAGDRIFKFQFEVYLPENYGVAEVDLSTLYMLLTSSNLDNPRGYSAFRIRASEIHNPGNPGSPVLKAGDYALITHAEKTTYGATQARPAKLSRMRVALQTARGNSNLDIVPVSLPPPAPNSALTDINIPIDPATVPPAEITTMEVDDPRVNKSVRDWKARTSGNTLAARNDRWSVGKAADNSATGPQSDTDDEGKISDVSFFMPPPAGKSIALSRGTISNLRGRVLSAGELGFLHTGIEPCSVVVDANGSTSVVPVGGKPWRSLRLQPNSAGADVVPDWALMDLFTAPNPVTEQDSKYIFSPHETSYGGRVNINSKAEPFDLARVTPLEGVLKGCTYDSANLSLTLDAAKAKEKAAKLYGKTYATAAGGKQYGYAGGFDSVGEICEIEGIADEGEKSEEVIREIANLITTRGNVFSIYSIGQSLKQTPNGSLLVQGEQRLQSMVERFSYTDSASGEARVRIAQAYYRSLTP